MTQQMELREDSDCVSKEVDKLYYTTDYSPVV